MKDYTKSDPGIWTAWYRVSPTFRLDTGLSKANMALTHRMVRRFMATSPGHAYLLSQAEKWSPNGEGRTIIEQAGVHHTSASVGDVLESPSGTLWQIDDVGFYEVPGLGQRFSTLENNDAFQVVLGYGAEFLPGTWIKDEHGGMGNAYRSGNKNHRVSLHSSQLVYRLPF